MDTLLTIIDKTGNAAPTTVAKDGIAETLLSWYREAPADVVDAVAELQTALDRGEPTGELEEYLSITIIRQPS